MLKIFECFCKQNDVLGSISEGSFRLPVEKFSSIDFVFIYAVDDEVVFFDSVYFAPEANVGEFVVCLSDDERSLQRRVLRLVQPHAETRNVTQV